MVDGVWVYWFGLLLLCALLFPAFVRWAAQFLFLCIDLIAQVAHKWETTFPPQSLPPNDSFKNFLDSPCHGPSVADPPGWKVVDTLKKEEE
jgi:hypothetical protein